MKIGKTEEQIIYDGKLQTKNFNIGALFDQNSLNNLNLNA